MRIQLAMWVGIVFALSATATPAGDLSTDSVTFSLNALAEGSLGHLETDDRQANDSGLPLQHLTLTGEYISIEIDWSASDLAVAGNTIAPERIDTDKAAYEVAVVKATRLGNLSYVFLAPLPGHELPRITMETQRASVSPATPPPSSVSWVASEREPPSGLDHGVMMTSRDGAYIVVEGSFLVSLWDIDILVEHEHGPDNLWTGQRSEETGPITAGETRRQQAYMLVADGRLELRTPDGLPVAAALEADAVQGEGLVTLSGASGTLHTTTGPFVVERQDVRLMGASLVRLNQADASVGVEVIRADDVRVNGEPVTLATSAPAPTAPSTGVAAIAAALVVVVGVMVAWRVRVRAAGWLRLEEAMERSRYDVVARDGKRFLRGRRAREASILVGSALIRDDRPEEALKIVGEPRRGSREQKAARAYIAAIAFFMLGDPERARASVQECLRYEPSMRLEVSSNGYLSRFLVERNDDRNSDVA
jgi:hypothetical protein